MKLYKLTTQDDKTRPGMHNETIWGPNVQHSALRTFNATLGDALNGIPDTERYALCTATVIHAYEDPRIAVLMNSAHANLWEPKLWEAEGEIVVRDGQLKCGVKTLTTIKEIPLPQITEEQQKLIAIEIALKVSQVPSFVQWANAWLDGTDRSSERAKDLIVAGIVSDTAYFAASTVAYPFRMRESIAKVLSCAKKESYTRIVTIDIISILNKVIQ